MTKEEILSRLQQMMADLFDLEPAQIQPEAHLIDDLDLDSIDAIDMAVKLQELTGRRIPESKLQSIRTVTDVVDLVHVELEAAPDAVSASLGE